MLPLEIFCLIRSLAVADNDKGEARVGRLIRQVLETRT
jgi:hypothetical protein